MKNDERAQDKTATENALKALHGVRDALLEDSKSPLLQGVDLSTDSIEVIGKDPAEVFKFLYGERTMTFAPSEPPKGILEKDLLTALSADELKSRLSKIYEDSRISSAEHGYSVLYLALGFCEWPLNWIKEPEEKKESESTNKSPLVLIPLKLTTQVRNQYFISWDGSSVFTNPALRIVFEKFSEIEELPEFKPHEPEWDIGQYFKDVQTTVAKHSECRFSEDIFFCLFPEKQFGNFFIYQDLDPEHWEIEELPLIKEILNPYKAIKRDPGTYAGASPLSKPKGDPQDNDEIHPILEADYSQAGIIAAAKDGRNLVVEGPPGTGKSQTIVNIISELLSDGKTVLFVSEKTAALDVVRSRLDEVKFGDLSLSDFCLGLYSGVDSNRVIAELERTDEVRKKIEGPSGHQYRDVQFDDDIIILKKALEDYVEAIGEPFGNFEYSPYELFGIYEKAYYYFHTKDTKRSPLIPRIKFAKDQLHKKKRNDWDEANKALEDLASSYGAVSPVAQNPWQGCNPPVELVARDLPEYAEKVEECQTVLNTLEVNLKELADVCCSHYSADDQWTPRDSDILLQAAEVLADSLHLAPEILLNEAWNFEDAKALVQKVECVQEAHGKVEPHFTDKALNANEEDIEALLEGLQEKSFLNIFGKRIKAEKEIKDRYYDPENPPKQGTYSDHLGNLKSYIQGQKDLKDSSATGASFFGEHWKGKDSNTTSLLDIAGNIENFQQQLYDEKLTAAAASKGITIRGEVSEHMGTLKSARETFVDKRDALFGDLGTTAKTLFDVAADEVSFKQLSSHLKEWRENLEFEMNSGADQNNFRKLLDWQLFLNDRKKCKETIAAPLLDCLEDLDPEDLGPCFEGNLADELISEVLKKFELLRRFRGKRHEEKIKEFRKLDRKCVYDANRRHVSDLLSERYRNIGQVSDSDSEKLKEDYNTLLGQFSLGNKRRLLPIRSLLSYTGEFIQKLKPCFIMDSRSIAQFCPPNALVFDVVVFDEASQISPPYAFSAFLRAKQAIVIGDTKQLPPTNFFGEKWEKWNAQEYVRLDVRPEEVESILHQCRRCDFHEKKLEWHYRSSHESLITFSNENFYNGNLMVYPSGTKKDDKGMNLGLEFFLLSTRDYRRGEKGDNTNPAEAESVVTGVMKHYRDYPAESIGIATFNEAQQRCIYAEIDKQLAIPDNNHLRRYFYPNREQQGEPDAPLSVREPCFVKNLESLQGDERDVIFISVGYGWSERDDEKKGKGLNRSIFQQLNALGGDRRLNVMITRQRKRCIVYCNFLPDDLGKIEEPGGLLKFKEFLSQAQRDESSDNGVPPKALGIVEGDNKTLQFEDAVYDYLKPTLEEEGYNLERYVGTSTYRIDFTVSKKANPGRYLLGIECDGFQYSNVSVTRDRDRLMPQVLENSGWALHRIWSVEWYHDRAGVQQRLLDTVKEVEHKVEEAERAAASRAAASRAAASRDDQQHDIHEVAQDYVRCNDLKIPMDGELGHQDPERLVPGIIEVVRVEGPVHTNDVISRVRSLWPGRSRVVNVILHAADRAIQTGEIRRDTKEEAFLWFAKEQTIPVRRRDSPNIEYICESEIAEAMKLLLKRSIRLQESHLIAETGTCLGFSPRANKTFLERIRGVLEAGIAGGEFERDGQTRWVRLPKA